MQIKDISVNDIRAGKKWKVISPNDIDWENILLEDTPIQECSNFKEDDLVVYSAIYVADDENQIIPIVMIKEAFSVEYGGDYCELIDGHWRQVGLEPNPNYPFGNEYIASPLEEDQSFTSDDQDYRKWHQNKFKKYIDLL